MQSKAVQSPECLTSQIIDSFAQSIQAMHFVRMRRFLTAYGKSIVDRLSTRARMPCLYFAIQLNDKAISLSCIKEILNYEPNIHFKDTFGNTYLHHCCHYDNLLAFKLFFSLGLSAKTQNIHKQSVLFTISKYNNEQILQYLSSEQKEQSYLNDLVNEIDAFGRTPLFYAAEQGNLTICEILLKLGASVNIIDYEGHEAEYYAKKKSKTQVTQLLASYRAPERYPISLPQDLVAYNMIFLNEKSVPHMLSILEVLKLIEDNEPLRSMLENPENIQQADDDEQDVWKSEAEKAVKQCLLQKGSQYFCEPVNQEWFGITDYYEVITDPIDFSTISKKLAFNGYEKKEDFQADVMRIYENALTYNGQDSHVTILAKEITNFFKQIWKI